MVIFLVSLLGRLLIATVFSILIWAVVEVAIEMFRHRDFKGVHLYDGGSKFDMSNWFDSIPGEVFYR